MRSWRKTLSIVAGGLASLGALLPAARAQFPPSPGGMMAPPPGAMMGMPAGMGARPGMGMPMGMPTGMAMPPGADKGMPSVFGGPPMGAPADFPNPAQPAQDPVSPFSIKDVGTPNAWTAEGYPREPIRWQLSAGYTFMWFTAQRSGVLATTGSVNDPIPGAIGQPNTLPLSGGDRPAGVNSAFRINSMYWLKDPEAVGLETSFFIMAQNSQGSSFASDANGTPVLSRPYYDAGLNLENADPRAVPGALRGTISDNFQTRMMGAEMNLKFYSSRNFDGSNFGFFAGARWFRLDEAYSSFDTATDIGGGGFANTFSDTFATTNQFFGGQFGLEWQYTLQRFTLGLVGKVAVGPNSQTIRISGQTTQDNLATGVLVADAQGLYAQPSNVGTYHASQLTVVPEVDVKAQFELTDRIRFSVGYGFMTFNTAVRPGDQLDRNINIQPLLSGGGFAPNVPGPPIFHTSVFSVNFINVALEFIF